LILIFKKVVFLANAKALSHQKWNWIYKQIHVCTVEGAAQIYQKNGMQKKAQYS